MGVKDQGLQEYLKDNERFADFMNGTLFAGKQIVDPCYLKEVQRKKRVSCIWKESAISFVSTISQAVDFCWHVKLNLGQIMRCL